MSTLMQDKIDAARVAAQIQGRRAIELLEESSGLSPQALTAALAETVACEAITLDAMLACTPAFDRISYSEALQHECVALRESNGRDPSHLLLVHADIYNLDLSAWASEHLGAPFKTRLAHRTDIAAYLARQEDSMRAVDSALDSVRGNDSLASQSEELSISTIEGDISPVVKLVRSTLYDGLKADASDIHLESVPGGMVIKYRLDGVMSQVGAVTEQAMAEQAISRIKVMAELDITEQRVPQDGRFRALYRGREVDFRVSVMPSIHGEDVELHHLVGVGTTRAGDDLPLAEHEGVVAIGTRPRGQARMDHDQAQHPERHLRHLVMVRVVHERAVLDQRELVLEGLAGADHALTEPSHSVHAARKQDAVPVHGGWSAELVRDVDAHAVALDRFDRWSVYEAVVAPALGLEPRRELVQDGLGDQVIDLDAVDELPAQGCPIRSDDGRVVDAGLSRRVSSI